MPKNITYLRVSTLEQDNAKTKTDILSLANEKAWEKWNLWKIKFREKYLGKKDFYGS